MFRTETAVVFGYVVEMNLERWRGIPGQGKT